MVASDPSSANVDGVVAASLLSSSPILPLMPDCKMHIQLVFPLPSSNCTTKITTAVKQFTFTLRQSLQQEGKKVSKYQSIKYFLSQSTKHSSTVRHIHVTCWQGNAIYPDTLVPKYISGLMSLQDRQTMHIYIPNTRELVWACRNKQTVYACVQILASLDQSLKMYTHTSNTPSTCSTVTQQH